MKKLFTFKKLSSQITFLVGVIILIVAGGVAGYMQTRIITEIGRHSRLNLQYQIAGIAEEGTAAFLDAVYRSGAIREFAASYFDIAEYRSDAENYFDTQIRPVMSGLVRTTIENSDFITAAYFAVHPDLAGRPLVREIFFEDYGYGAEEAEPQTYEEYMQADSEDMAWFYGPYRSRRPYWSPVYAWADGTIMVSYTEPVIIDGVVIGIAGVDICIGYIKNLIQNVRLYDTGFALLRDSHGEFFDSNEVIRRLGASERSQLIETARASNGGVFEVRLGGTVYLGAETLLFNDYELFILAPKSEVNAEVTASLIRFSVIFVVAYTLVLIVAFIIGKRMGKPLAALSAFMRRAGATGNILYTPEDEKGLNAAIESGGEIGRLVQDSGIFIDHIIEASRELESIASGDLTVEIKILSEQDTMANSLNKMISNLNLLFNEVHNSAGQVAGGSKQIAEGAQSLASNSGEQSEIVGNIAGSAEKGGVQMQNLINSVNEINEASKDIIKVMKLIDDVALKTNILALNASVEAVRAGEYGRSFSVVAEEVRSLAAQSTQAAKETSLMIENSIEKAEAGSRIAGETSRSFTQIIDGINKVTETVSVNSAAAEESAAAAEEMSAQSVTLENLIARFKLKNGQ